MRSWQVSILALCLGLHELPAQAPPGYHIGASSFLPDSLVEVTGAGRFRMTVRRTAASARERELLMLAERLYPAPDSILRVARDTAYREKLVAASAGVVQASHRVTPRVAGVPGDRWWLDDFDATWLPYAVTGGAVAYYMERLRDLAAGRGQFTYAPDEPPDSGSFHYQASVRAILDSGSTHVVEMKISWSYWCGYLCPVWFNHSRTVWFDSKGAVIRITGDGRPSVIVS